MKAKLFFYIAFRIVLLFSFGFLFSFVWDADGIHDFMGDTLQESRIEKFREIELKNDSENKYDEKQALQYGHDGFCPFGEHYHWGTRHHWLAWCTIFLLILSVIDIIIAVRRAVLNEYPNLNN